MDKIRSGIYGLNSLMDGGFNEKSTTVVIGSPGAGKTTFATQYIKRGLEDDQSGIFVSLDENQDQIINEAIERGWTEINDFIDSGLLLFIDASGKEFSTFIREELPSFVNEWEGANARIAIDPLTPVVWAIQERYEQRELLSFLLKEMRKIGTVLCTLEEHGFKGDLSGKETIIPMYLADCVIHLKYVRGKGEVSRNMEIVKCRNSRHSKKSHMYKILRGFGIVLKHSGDKPDIDNKISKEIRSLIDDTDTISDQSKRRIRNYLDNLKDEDFQDLRIEEVIDDILEEYS
jgi:KaiC/GvpD/RAD55 family RecA-like ATPase